MRRADLSRQLQMNRIFVQWRLGRSEQRTKQSVHSGSSQTCWHKLPYLCSLTFLLKQLLFQRSHRPDSCLIVGGGRNIPANVTSQPQANRAERRRAFVPSSASAASLYCGCCVLEEDGNPESQIHFLKATAGPWRSNKSDWLLFSQPMAS